MSTLALSKIKHDSSSIDNITLNSNGTTSTSAELVVPSLKGTSGNKLQLRSGDSSYGVSLQNVSGIDLLTVDAVGRVTTPYQPRFRATQGSSNIVSKGDIFFTSKDFDVGGNYNTANGRFTAPVPGYYFFYLTALYVNAGSSTTWKVVFLKNGSQDSVAGEWQNSPGSSYNTMFNACQVIYLATNDWVNMYNDGTSGTGAVHISGGQTKFGGYLIG